MSTKDPTKVVALITRDGNNKFATNLVSNGLPVFWHLRTPCPTKCLKEAVEMRDIPWNERAVAIPETSGIRLNPSALARKGHRIYQTVDAS